MNILIMAAGNNSRFNGKIKCLQKYKDKTVLEHLLDTYIDCELNPVVMLRRDLDYEYVDKVTSIMSSRNIVENVIYTSKNGTASQMEDYLEATDGEHFFISWSDMVPANRNNIIGFTNMIKDSDFDIAIPVVKQTKPYVSVLLDADTIPYDFMHSKKGHGKLKRGYHDQSLFFVSRRAAELCINVVSGLDERDFLDVLHMAYEREFCLSAWIYNKKFFAPFNTIKEFEKITKKT